MRRREFITLLGSAAAWPLAARAQQTTLPVIRFLHTGSLETRRGQVASFNRGLSETGYIEGQNLTIEYRWAHDQIDRLPIFVTELVRRPVTLIAAVGGTPAALAAKTATSTIPILFQIGADPVKLGLVISLNRPGGNITGVTNISGELTAKRIELLHELVPAATAIAVLVNPINPASEAASVDLVAAAQVLGLRTKVLRASTEKEIETAVATVSELHAGGLVVTTDPFFVSRRDQLAVLTARHAIPTIYEFREFVAAGGLIAYGTSVTDMFRLVGVYAGRILKGEKPADLPVIQPTKFELVINLKTAKALGLEVPPTLLALADEVIE
jgi:putative ABC transport system substrate-binding protein